MDRNNLEAKVSLCDDFQKEVSQILIRHKSILDIMTKLDEYNARINRAVAKSVTTCGCLEINAHRQNFDSDSFGKLPLSAKSHVEGNICDSCSDVLEEEIGSYMFYLAALCDTLEISLQDVLEKEFERARTLGIYSLK
ncbi:nucleoside triphosphate pyrophosphohydrolase family protein [Paratissierella segnis]|uniref:DUF1573 domain-containing protein n=1 Tax=Paratissierella segnis TaxID=2763679 RepID=A0A926EX44_9FIRM|nr:DUF1573 domain-containing protein [Paratissierella segnis]MBC8588034.1 DUF1573 domain-containing protein [Paratissierella segnis]